MPAGRRRSRLKISAGLEKRAKRHGLSIHSDPLQKALRNFLYNPNLAALKFQRVVGREGYWKFRVTLSLHVLLRQEFDAEGKYFLAVGVETHDDYRR